jgi:hypothetical protein
VKYFVGIVLYGLCVVLVLVILQYTNIGDLIRQDKRSHPSPNNPIVFDATVIVSDHRLPAKVEDHLYSVLNRSLRHRFMNEKGKGEVLEDLLQPNRCYNCHIQPCFQEVK